MSIIGELRQSPDLKCKPVEPVHVEILDINVADARGEVAVHVRPTAIDQTPAAGK